jgi:hypothetical protein
MPSAVLDRSCFEKAFGVKRRRAIELMHRFGGYQAGKTFLIERTSLLRRLERLERGEEFGHETSRRTRLADELDRVSRALPARQVRIQASADVYDRRLADLPSVSLRPGKLEVEFHGTEDLLRNLFELAQAIQNDYRRFEQICEGT